MSIINKFTIKKILRFILKKILNNFFNFFQLDLIINELENEEYVFSKIKKTKNSHLKQKKLEQISKNKKFNYLKVYILDELYNIMLHNSDSNAFKVMDYYYREKINWKKKNKLNFLNFHFLREQLFTGSLGNYASCYEYIESKKYKLNDDTKLIFLKSKNSKITNNALFSYFLDHIEYIENNDIFNKINQSRELALDLPLGHSFEIGNHSTFPDLGYNFILQEKHKKNLKREMLFNLKSSHIDYGYKQLKKIGITDKDWWVTIHCRSGLSKNDKKTEYWRNSNINKFYEAIHYINKKGGYVFRMGDDKMPKIEKSKVNSNMVIDYAHSDLKNDVMDIFLGAKSKFHLGTSSGYPIIPRMFGVPLLLCETTQTLPYWSLNDFDVFLPRIYQSTIDNSIINFNNAFKPPYSIIW